MSNTALDTLFKSYLSIAEQSGLTGQEAVTAACRGVETSTGVNPLEAMGIKLAGKTPARKTTTKTAKAAPKAKEELKAKRAKAAKPAAQRKAKRTAPKAATPANSETSRGRGRPRTRLPAHTLRYGAFSNKEEAKSAYESTLSRTAIARAVEESPVKVGKALETLGFATRVEGIKTHVPTVKGGEYGFFFRNMDRVVGAGWKEQTRWKYSVIRPLTEYFKKA